jgi:transcription antitermination factor NusG
MLVRLDRNPEFLKMAAEYEARAAAEPTIPRDADLVAGRAPAWHLLVTAPNRERTAASNLSGRRFGVFLPEFEENIIKHGRPCTRIEPLFRGYLLIFVWDIDRHRDRIMACPGVAGIMRRIDSGAAVELSDALVDQIRAIENANRPLRMTIETVAKKKRWRQSIKKTSQIDVHDNDIMGVRAYSPFDRIAELDQLQRNRLLMNALGLAS